MAQRGQFLGKLGSQIHDTNLRAGPGKSSILDTPSSSMSRILEPDLLTLAQIGPRGAAR
jgi:hypothetical protein